MAESITQTAAVSKGSIWAGRTISALVVMYLLFDSAIRVMKLDAAVGGAVRLGYPESLIVPIGIIELVCIVVYVIPRSSVLGAILLTGYLGGATAVILRLENLWSLLPIGLGVLVWGGLFLRDDRVRAIIPLRK